VDDASVLRDLAGPRNERLKTLERESGVTVGVRGNKVLLEGDAEGVAVAERFLTEAVMLLGRGIDVHTSDVPRAVRLLRRDPEARLDDMFDDAVVVAGGRKAVGPRGLAQKRYVEAIRTHDLTFGIGPAGTGKTYLAMA
jgi:phosphate starvation-inducible PhoH-like protein